MKFTIWNRRKYGISASVVGVRIPHLDVGGIADELHRERADIDHGGFDWEIKNGEVIAQARESIKAGEYANFEVAVVLNTPYVLEDDVIYFDTEVKAFVFDPVKREHFVIANSGIAQDALVAQFKKEWWTKVKPGPDGN